MILETNMSNNIVFTGLFPIKIVPNGKLGNPVMLQNINILLFFFLTYPLKLYLEPTRYRTMVVKILMSSSRSIFDAIVQKVNSEGIV